MLSFFQNLFFNRSLRRLRQAIETIRSKDFSLQYGLHGLHGEERRLVQEINAVVKLLREDEHRHERQVQFYEALLGTVSAMLIATDENGKVKWMNQAAIEGLCGFRIDDLNQLAALSPTLPQELQKLKKGNTTLLELFSENQGMLRFSVTLSFMFSKGIRYRIYHLQQAETVVQQSETMAQQRLVRVMNHEIMNSLTPIISLSQTLADHFHKDLPGETDMTREDISMALDAINRRAGGLMTFVENYRKLSGVGEPCLTPVKLGELTEGLRQLMHRKDEEAAIDFRIENLCEDLVVHMDRNQIEQVLINLLKNAEEAKASRIVLRAERSEDRRKLLIAISDNGHGFTPDAAERIFTPFFTTKQGGQGIGLAICQQIVSKHGGLITAQSKAEGETTFIVRLPAV